MTTDTIRALRTLRHPDVARATEIFPDARRDELLAALVGHPRPVAAATRKRGRRAPMPRLLLPSLGALAVAVILLVLATGSAVHPPVARGAVTFRTAADGDVVATVTNPFVAEDELNAAFAARGIHITVDLAPVSPSLVGTVVYSSDNGGASQIQSLGTGPCVTGGGACPIGVRIPAAFSGTGYITLGRPATSGEDYDSTASAFAPGEALHCSGLLGARVSSVLAGLQAHNLTVAQWRVDGRPVPSQPSEGYVWQIDPVAAGTVRVWTRATPWPDTAVAGSNENQGCPAGG